MQGYCYQFWRCRHNAFRADGAFGQYIIVMPDQDAVIAITCETPDMQGEINLVWKYVLPAMHPAGLAENKIGDAGLNSHLAALALPPLPQGSDGQAPEKLFSIKPNALNIGSMEVKFRHDTCRLLLGVNAGVYELNFGIGKYLPGSTSWPAPSLLQGAKEDFSFLAPYKVDGSYTWLDNNTLELKLRYIESPHSEIITCHFNNGQLTATMEPSFSYGQHKVQLQSE